MTPALYTTSLTIGYPVPRQAPVIVAADLNLALNPGELVCLLGPNGAGKSTLLHTLAGTLKPLAGTVTLATCPDRPLHHLRPDELAQAVSIVLTDHPDVGLLTGHGLVALGRYPYTGWWGTLSAHDEQVIQAALVAVDAVAFADRSLNTLSDGQRQKLWIARALAQATPVMLLDEPTAYLDLPRRAELMHLLRRLARETDRAILLSTHDLEFALRTADRVWLLAADGTMPTGAPEDLVLSGAFERVFRSSSVRFDPVSGTFKTDDPAPCPLRLIVAPTLTGDADHLRPIWTRRALERAGYHLTDTPAAASVTPLTVTVSHDGWQLESGGMATHHPTLDTLLQALAAITAR